MDFLHRVQAVLVLGTDGCRIFTKYYVGGDASKSSNELASLEKQRSLESSIMRAIDVDRRGFSNCFRSEVVAVEGHAVVFQRIDSGVIFLVGADDENYLVLSAVLTGLVNSLKRTTNDASLGVTHLLQNYAALLMTVDEMLDEGIILETDASTIATNLEPYLIDVSNDTARAALSGVNKYLRDNL